MKPFLRRRLAGVKDSSERCIRIDIASIESNRAIEDARARMERLCERIAIESLH